MEELSFSPVFVLYGARASHMNKFPTYKGGGPDRHKAQDKSHWIGYRAEANHNRSDDWSAPIGISSVRVEESSQIRKFIQNQCYTLSYIQPSKSGELETCSIKTLGFPTLVRKAAKPINIPLSLIAKARDTKPTAFKSPKQTQTRIDLKAGCFGHTFRLHAILFCGQRRIARRFVAEQNPVQTVLTDSFPTRKRLNSYFQLPDLDCSLCGSTLESTEHLFYHCPVIRALSYGSEGKLSSPSIPDKTISIPVAHLSDFVVINTDVAIRRDIIVVAMVVRDHKGDLLVMASKLLPPLSPYAA
ncbi:hypothetical protein FNV43_RR16213 [Rhamnella rubrinervis]|uniref:Reverse transcriptase zinc-binding domain-containing protein n=1 Tax=Rhamnella rubrinervis TaxID=2594499 RepID=A0A8K0EDQ2_9ROSA|nr:hypothetical protein FNV43_RR16213 [Rhamnella rubrinervis]